MAFPYKLLTSDLWANVKAQAWTVFFSGFFVTAVATAPLFLHVTELA